MKRKNKVIIGAGIGLGLLGTGAYFYERSQKEMLQFEYEGICKEEEPNKDLTQAEKEKISDMIKGMSEEELRIALQNIPVGLMFDEVASRLDNYTAFVNGIENAFKYLPK